jgi:hypothetical protein
MSQERNHRQRAMSRAVPSSHSSASVHQPHTQPSLSNSHSQPSLKESLSSPEIYLFNISSNVNKETNHSNNISNTNKEKDNTTIQTLSRTITKIHSKFTHPPKHFAQLKPEQIAQQLTLIDFEIYSQIQVFSVSFTLHLLHILNLFVVFLA